MLNFSRPCTHVDYKDEKVCRFYEEKGKRQVTLAIIPYENILWIENVGGDE